MISQNTACASRLPADKQTAIRRHLETRHAVNAAELARQLGADTEAVRGTLDTMVLGGGVKRLRPLRRRTPDQDYYRLVRDNDSEGRWQQIVMNMGPYREHTLIDMIEEAQRWRRASAWSMPDHAGTGHSLAY